MSTASICILGPQASGKTRYAKALARHYGLAKIIEGDEHGRQNHAFPRQGALILTNSQSLADHLAARGTTVVSIESARRAAGV